MNLDSWKSDLWPRYKHPVCGLSCGYIFFLSSFFLLLMLSCTSSLPSLTLEPSLPERTQNGATWKTIRMDLFTCLVRGWEMKQSSGQGQGEGHRQVQEDWTWTQERRDWALITGNQNTGKYADLSQAFIWGLIPENQRWRFNARHMSEILPDKSTSEA